MRATALLMAMVVVAAATASVFATDGDNADRRYGIVLDAGSSGTRVYLFTWLHENEVATLEEVMHKKVSPGVSYYADEPAKAAASVQQLLDIALARIPEGVRSTVPVTLQATAGMRLLPKEESEVVLAEIRKLLSSSGLVFTDHDVRIVDGCSEGRYLFHAVNEALGKLGRTSELVATLDLGGASTQIAMPLPSHAPGPFRFDVLACKAAGKCPEDAQGVPLYTVSRLGFGMNEAYKAFLADHRFTDTTGVSPCLFRGQTDDTEEVAPFTYTGEGDYDRCLALVRKFVAAREAAGLYGNPDMNTMPPLNLDVPYYVTDNFPKVVIPTLEYNQAVPAGTLLVERTPASLQDEARSICAQPFDAVWSALLGTKATRRKKVCFGLAYITSLLEMYGFPADHPFNFALEINGVDMNWPLGAIIEQIHAVDIDELATDADADADAEL